MKVWIRNRQRRIRVRMREVSASARKILLTLGCLKAELSLLLVNDAQIRRLNKQYRRINRPTDVLAFPMLEGGASPLRSQLLGDVVISLETAKKQAKKESHSLEQEVKILLIHGILHLLGYHHEDSDEAAGLVERKTQAILEELERD
ncbi:MAG TPA: rRNA maturation RNase YbeY [Nitrospiria bacterium]|jgi:probable rRNA maturation factor|nr:rRNA maturation RNase YbeY [Nitrospiria bacterium]